MIQDQALSASGRASARAGGRCCATLRDVQRGGRGRKLHVEVERNVGRQINGRVAVVWFLFVVAGHTRLGAPMTRSEWPNFTSGPRMENMLVRQGSSGEFYLTTSVQWPGHPQIQCTRERLLPPPARAEWKSVLSNPYIQARDVRILQQN